MKLLVYGPNPRMESGMGKVGFEMARGLAARDFDVHYFAPDCEAGPARSHEGFQLHGSPGGGNMGRGMFRRKVAELDPDALITNRNWQSVTWLSEPVNQRYMNTGDPMPVVFYGPPIETEWQPPAFEGQLLEDHLNDVYLIPYTKSRRADYENWGLGDYLLDDAPFVPHGVDHDIFFPDDQSNIEQNRAAWNINDRFAVAFVGENWRRKNLDLLFDAFYLFKESIDGNPILICHTSPVASRGDDEFYAGWNLANTGVSYGLTASTDNDATHPGTDVFWTMEYPGDYKSRDTVSAILNLADVMCLPTSGEAFSLTSLEAMATGTPVAQTRVETLEWLSGDAAEYIDWFQTHAINSGERHVTPETESIQATLRYLYDDADRRDEMAKAGVKRAADFSWERMADELATCMDEIEARSL